MFAIELCLVAISCALAQAWPGLADGWFSRIEQRTFPLSALPLGEIQLRDLALDAAHDKLVVQARFGSL